MGSLLCVGLVFVSSCDKDTRIDCETVTFDENIIGILNNSCNTSGCHDGAAGSARQPLTNFAEASASSAGILKRAVTDKDMPPNGKISDDAMYAIQCWIDNGKKEN